MQKKITLEDLKSIQKRVAQTTAVREGEQAIKVTVHMGTCGIAAGAREVMAALLDEMKSQDAGEVQVTHASCVGLCDREPIVTVEKDNTTVRYGQVTPDMVRRIYREHVLGNHMISEWIIKGAS
jgi:(2Fe-2S) ferredoxin